MMGDLAIAYRIYPGVSKVPPIFSDDKYKLSELCLKSFKKSLGNLKVKIWVLLDNCPTNYDNLFKKYFTDEELELIHLDGIGNAGTFYMQLKILTEQDFSDYVYFAEDDYFYLPDKFPEMIEFLQKNPLADFVSPYNHPDYYTHPIHKYNSEEISFNNTTMKTVATTTMTFMTKKTILINTKEIFKTYAVNNYDASLWLSLTKINIFHPRIYFKYIFKNKQIAKIFFKLWLMCLKQILFGKRRKLYIPVPSFATHMDDVHMAPDINWKNEFQKFL